MDKQASEDLSDTWTIVSKSTITESEGNLKRSEDEQQGSGVAEIKKCYLNIPNINVHTDDEISDGISVISDNEDRDCDHDHSDNNEESIDWNKEELKIEHKRKKLMLEQKETKDENFPLTPPSTPTVDSPDLLQIQTLNASSIEKVDTTPSPRLPVNFRKLLLIGGVVTMLAAILINNYQLNNLKRRAGVDVYSSEHEQRITELEIEKQILRNEIDRIKESLQGGEPFPDTKTTNQKKKERKPQQASPRKPTEQKLVWSGQENDPLVIPDNMFHLPDYCTKTYNANDELFDEYNKNLCEKIQKKIDERSKKSKNSKKLAKDLNNLRQMSTEHAEIFVEIENEDEIVENDVLETLEMEKFPIFSNNNDGNIKESSSKTQQETPKSDGEAQNNQKGQRHSKEEFEKYQREKQEKYVKQNRKNGENVASNKKQKQENDFGEQRKNDKNEYNQKLKKKYSEEFSGRKDDVPDVHKKENSRKHDNERKFTNGSGDKKHQKEYSIEEQKQYNEVKEEKFKEQTDSSGGKKHRKEQKQYNEMKQREKQEKFKDHKDGSEGKKNRKKYSSEEQKRYNDIKEEQFKGQTDGSGGKYSSEEHKQYNEMKKKEKQDKFEDHKWTNGSGERKHREKYGSEEQKQYNEMKQKEKQAKFRERTDGENKKETKRDYEKSKQHKHHKDSDERPQSSGDKRSKYSDNDYKNHDEHRKPNKDSEWHGKRMEQREFSRQKQNHNKDDKNGNWYLERGTEREMNRFFDRQSSGDRESNWYLDRAGEREIARAVEDENYQKHI